LDAVNRSNFPRNFVLKSNHGSGASVICWEGATPGNLLPNSYTTSSWEKYIIHPDDLIWNNLVELSTKWISRSYYWEIGKYPEWAYKNISPLLIAEEVLTHNGKIPEDYKFYMVNGKCSFIHVRVTENSRDLFYPDWRPIDAKYLYPKSGFIPNTPDSLDEMLKLAELLSEGIDFIRVDLYITDSGVKFGELTNYPDGGMADITPKKLSVDLIREFSPEYIKFAR
jgi:hypothetical protein